ncbi:hypothetical protein Cha6605_3622 [Chamaesiphon minutus PCC 6605]|uniref:Uncharacterized protein n=1 Tax=Chamaesiphon minutus (strain ATCC 27169 / PCC 6605) TaxID=1173020 RepID=K9UIG6_CHAP6|nr:hypothetical protein Cha6605_3622 [Chamaesiphon minutus PCC 6605]
MKRLALVGFADGLARQDITPTLNVRNLTACPNTQRLVKTQTYGYSRLKLGTIIVKRLQDVRN